MDNELDNIVTLFDEDGQSANFEFIDAIEYKDELYIVLLPCGDESEEAQDVLILKLENVGLEDESYTSVDDEQILSTVFEMFKKKNKDNFNFVD